MGKMMTTNIINDDRNYLVDVYFLDADHDHVQTLGKFSIGFNHGRSWSLITLYI